MRRQNANDFLTRLAPLQAGPGTTVVVLLLCLPRAYSHPSVPPSTSQNNALEPSDATMKRRCSSAGGPPEGMECGCGAPIR